MVKSVRAWINTVLNSVAAPPEHVLEFVRVPQAPEWVPADAKVDYLYWLRVLPALNERLGEPISSFLEVGANYAQDAWFIAQELMLDPNRVAVMEPLLTNIDLIRRHTPFLALPYAIAQESGEIELWVPTHDSSAWGIASIGQRSIGDAEAFTSLMVDAKSGRDVLDELGWQGVDLLKIDVEGFSGMALRSFGPMLENVKAIQIETERVPIWQGQETEAQVFEFLREAGFIMLEYELSGDDVQADSLWVSDRFAPARAFNRMSSEWVNIAFEVNENS